MYELDAPLSPTDVGGVGGAMDDSSKEAIAEMEQALQQYRDMISADETDTAAYGDTGYFHDGGPQYYYQRDDGYEGDLHASLGALLLADGDAVLAAVHLMEAVRLYEFAGDVDGQNMASVKFNLSALYLQNGEYRESARLHGEALDLFRQFHGEGADLLGAMGQLGLDEITEMLQRQQQQQQQQQQQEQQKGSPLTNENTHDKYDDLGKDDTTTEATEPAKGLKAQGANTVQFASGRTNMLIDVDGYLQQNNTRRDEL